MGTQPTVACTLISELTKGKEGEKRGQKRRMGTKR